MEATIDPSVASAIAEFRRAQKRLSTALNTTPSDKQDWSPSPTARTPIELVAHCALSLDGMRGMLSGEPFPFSSMTELDEFSRGKEKEVASAEAALDLLNANSDKYVSWMESLSDEFLEGTFNSPMGGFPMKDAITFLADHLRSHASQLEYIQTIIGDREMHMG